MAHLDLTGNDWVKQIPLIDGTDSWQKWALRQQFGLDSGPGYGGSGDRDRQWWPIETGATNDSVPETNYAKGLSTDDLRNSTVKLYTNYRPYLLAKKRSDYWQPENLSAFTGEPEEEKRWKRAGYCMGIPHAKYRHLHALNTDHNTTYTIALQEFSYLPGVYKLDGITEPRTHKFVFNVQVPWLELRGGQIGGYWSSVYHDGFPHRAPDYPLFGFSIERDTLRGLLSIQLVCPGETEWLAQQGEHILGEAITHDPMFGAPVPPYHQYPPMRVETGYVIQLFISEDKTTFALTFNGMTVYGPTRLPDSIIEYFRNPPHALIQQDGVNHRGVRLSEQAAEMCRAAYPNVYTPAAIEAYGKPSMGIGMAMMDNLTRTPGGSLPDEDPNSPWYFYYIVGPVFSLHKVTKNKKPYTPGPLDPPGTGGTRAAPYYMNRADGLNSTAPWANKGLAAALWQRNNAR